MTQEEFEGSRKAQNYQPLANLKIVKNSPSNGNSTQNKLTGSLESQRGIMEILNNNSKGEKAAKTTRNLDLK